MGVFSNRFKNKILQLTYRPSAKAGKKDKPKTGMMKAFDEGLDGLLLIEEKDGTDEKGKDKGKADKKDEGKKTE